MKVIQERLPYSQLGLQIEVEAVRGAQAFEAIVRKYIKASRIPGFRPGKAPRPIVLQYFGKKALKAEALEKLLDEALSEAIKQENVEALGNFQVLSKFEELLAEFEPGQVLTFRAAVDVQPEVVLRPDYNALLVKHSAVSFDPGAVDAHILKTQISKSTLIPAAERPAALGDVAVIDFVGRNLAGEPLDGAKGTDFEVELQTDRFIPGFIDGIVGMNLEETREVPAQFPQDYVNKEFAGLEVLFTVTLKELKERKLPAIDDALAILSDEAETLEEWRVTLAKQFEDQAEQQTKDNRDAALLSTLLEGTTIDLPKTLVDQEFRYLSERTLQSLSQRGADLDTMLKDESILNILREQILQDAVARLRRTLALAEVARREQITVDEAEIGPRLAEYARTLTEEINRDTLESMVRDELLTEKILDWLTERSTIEITEAATALADGVQLTEELSPEPPLAEAEELSPSPEISKESEEL